MASVSGVLEDVFPFLRGLRHESNEPKGTEWYLGESIAGSYAKNPSSFVPRVLPGSVYAWRRRPAMGEEKSPDRSETSARLHAGPPV